MLRSRRWAALLLIAVVPSLAACVATSNPRGSSRPSTTESSSSPAGKDYTLSYTRADVEADGMAWPWKVDALTVTCSDTRGGAHTTVDGVTYGLTGRDATNATTRGYTDSTQLLSDPAGYEAAEPFLDKLSDECAAHVAEVDSSD